MACAARQVVPQVRIALESTAAHDRATGPNPGRKIRSESDAKAVRQVRKNRVLVRGRRQLGAGGRQIWDVFRIEGDDLVLVHAECSWYEEAIALASDALLGRISVSMAGVRTMFGGGGAVQAPRKGDIVLRDERPMTKTILPNGDIVLEGRSSPLARRRR